MIPSAPGASAAGPSIAALWWQKGLIYQIYPMSFMDSNGDGCGDLRGIIGRLDYCRWLGIDALWLSPIYPSPMVDFGYDISDFTDIHPLFGSLADFDALISEAGRLNLRVLLDYVPTVRTNTSGFLSRDLLEPTPTATGTSGAIRRRAAARPTTG
jgi:hypothetical protein